MPEGRLFHVAPDAVHVRVTYEGRTGTYAVHGAVVVRLEDGEVFEEPAESYQYLTADEALDVAGAVLASALGFG